MEIELRQALKLESVGRLAAGIAHEINTPVQFVGDSIFFLRDANRELMAVVKKLRDVSMRVVANAPAVEAAKEALAAEAAADLSYLMDHIPEAIDLAAEGLARVGTIVRSMKEFAHPDAREMVHADLNRAIERTIVVARSEYRDVADLETDLGILPPVQCHVGDINQAILNIVVNAAHAIGDVIAAKQQRGRITIETRSVGDMVTIRISDTGGGIPDSVRGRIFDPFFTTKGVGEGTGQGLALARSIVVEKHRGELSFETEVGVGTTFVLRLPITAST